MNVVVDLGCHTHAGYPEDESKNRLIERFEPRHYYGFDPHPDTPFFVFHDGDKLRVEVERAAAWTHEGHVGLVVPPAVMNPLRTHVTEGSTVRCFDLAEFLNDVGPAVVKMDVEGAEYTLIPHLIETGAIKQVSLLLIEWHGEPLLLPEDLQWEVWS